VCEKWKNLPIEIKSSENVKSFKANYRYRRHTGRNPSQAAERMLETESERDETG
jgi:hypothetical protein